MSFESATVVSASGKVLVAGGYLVLFQKYSGVVVSTSSRFYTVVNSGSNGSGAVVVKSPQFKDATWSYAVTVTEDGVRISQSQSDSSKNKFVYIALQQTLKLVFEIKGASYLREALSNGLDITIAGGNDFYSQRAKLAELGLEPLLSSLSSIPPFASTGVTLANVHKTGLGSSAALITSLVTGLLVHLSAILPSSLSSGPGPQSEGRILAHNVSQFVHCYAQGKVGSGFDVAAAAFGSQLYTRFNPKVISPLMTDSAADQPLLPILGPSNKAWDHKVESFQLPPFTRLMLADVDAGSDTPSLVGKVLKWRESDPAAEEIWEQINTSNQAFAASLLHLSSIYKDSPKAYVETVTQLAVTPSQAWSGTHIPPNPAASGFYNAYTSAVNVRKGMRGMGEKAGVPIEPPEQTVLLDECMKQAGVIACGVPGAGGYDAIWVLVLDPPSTKANEEKPLQCVERIWASCKTLDVSPLSATESFDKGLRLEKVEDVPGLAELVKSTV